MNCHWGLFWHCQMPLEPDWTEGFDILWHGTPLGVLWWLPGTGGTTSWLRSFRILTHQWKVSIGPCSCRAVIARHDRSQHIYVNSVFKKKFYEKTRVFDKVDCSVENLTCVGKMSGFWILKLWSVNAARNSKFWNFAAARQVFYRAIYFSLPIIELKSIWINGFVMFFK
jgi:hypothetical protein